MPQIVKPLTLNQCVNVKKKKDKLYVSSCRIRYTVAGKVACYSQTTSKLKCVGFPCRIIYTVFGKPPVSLLKLFDYIVLKFNNYIKFFRLPETIENNDFIGL